MSNVAQTVAIIGGLAALVGIIFGVQAAWIMRGFAQIDRRFERLEDSLGTMRTELSSEIRQIKSDLLKDHGERIARLEERAHA